VTISAIAKQGLDALLERVWQCLGRGSQQSAELDLVGAKSIQS